MLRHIDRHDIHGLIPLALVNDQLLLPALKVRNGFVGRRDVLTLLKHG